MANRSGDREETVVADEDDVEDGSSAEEVVHHQPELTQPSAQHPFACQDVGQINWNTKGPCGEQQTNQILATFFKTGGHQFPSRTDFPAYITILIKQSCL